MYNTADHISLRVTNSLTRRSKTPLSKEDTAIAGETLDTDIRPQPDNLPLAANAEMGLFKAYDITELYFRDHVNLTFTRQERTGTC